MSYLDTPHKRKSLVITIILHLVLLLLLFLVGLGIEEQENEGGIAAVSYTHLTLPTTPYV